MLSALFREFPTVAELDAFLQRELADLKKSDQLAELRRRANDFSRELQQRAREAMGQRRRAGASTEETSVNGQPQPEAAQQCSEANEQSPLEIEVSIDRVAIKVKTTSRS